MKSSPQRVAIVWHMHQPNYVWPPSGEPLLPWVRLHAAKSYSDMAGALEMNPRMRCTVNFSGVLIDQIQAAAERGVRDMHWALTERAADLLSPDERAMIVHHFFSLNWDRLVRPHPRYAELLALKEAGESAFEVQAMRDLQVLFNLQWCGWWLRAEVPALQELARRGRGYTEADKRVVLDAHELALARLRGRWQALVARDQVEVSFTPMYHPILPLLIDTDHARRCLPDHPMPDRYRAPKWAKLQVEMGRAVVSAWIGREIQGAWPAEGSVSPEAAAIFVSQGVRWIATDEDVLRQSVRDGAFQRNGWWRCRAGDGGVDMVFRDHELSDAIGFSYATIGAEEAIADFCRRVEQKRDGDGEGAKVVILDGENPWEAYPDDGQAFLCGLFEALAGHDRILSARVCDVLDGEPERGTIRTLYTGSWINGDFHIWIGAKAKNDAWNLLSETTAAAGDEPGREGLPQLTSALMAAQGSDWFWWYGDNFHSQNDADFDALFRAHCARVFTEAGASPPVGLGVPVDSPSLSDDLERPTRELAPTIDGRVTHYYEWQGAGVLRQSSAQGAMHRVARVASMVLYGYSAGQLHIRVDAMVGGALGACLVEVYRRGEAEPLARISLMVGETVVTENGRGALNDVAEVSLVVPPADVGAMEIVVEARSSAGLTERLPALGRWPLEPGAEVERWWLV